MLQGVHAETIVFTSYQQARSLRLDAGWPLVGTASEFGGRDVKLLGAKPRRFRIRVTGLRESGKAISCQLDLHDGDRVFAPLMRVELSFVPDGPNTRVRLTGATARDLTPASAMQGEMSRALANEYARALLGLIAKAMEARSGKSHLAARPRAASKALLQKHKR